MRTQTPTPSFSNTYLMHKYFIIQKPKESANISKATKEEQEQHFFIYLVSVNGSMPMSSVSRATYRDNHIDVVTTPGLLIESTASSGSS